MTQKPNFEQILAQKAKEKQKQSNLAISTAAYLADIFINKPLVWFGDTIKFGLLLPFTPAIKKVKGDLLTQAEQEALEEFEQQQAEWYAAETKRKAKVLENYIPMMEKEWQRGVNPRLLQRGVKNDPKTGKFTKKTKEQYLL